MVALRASSWDALQRFHAVAGAPGGSSAGAPALRPQYNVDVYAAYVRDPDGDTMAAVCLGYRAPALRG